MWGLWLWISTRCVIKGVGSRYALQFTALSVVMMAGMTGLFLTLLQGSSNTEARMWLTDVASEVGTRLGLDGHRAHGGSHRGSGFDPWGATTQMGRGTDNDELDDKILLRVRVNVAPDPKSDTAPSNAQDQLASWLHATSPWSPTGLHFAKASFNVLARSLEDGGLVWRTSHPNLKVFVEPEKTALPAKPAKNPTAPGMVLTLDETFEAHGSSYRQSTNNGEGVIGSKGHHPHHL